MFIKMALLSFLIFGVRILLISCNFENHVLKHLFRCSDELVRSPLLVRPGPAASWVSGNRSNEVTHSPPGPGEETCHNQTEALIIITRQFILTLPTSEHQHLWRGGRSQHRGQVGEHWPRSTGQNGRGAALSCLRRRGLSTKMCSESIRHPIVNLPGWRHSWSNPGAVSLHLGGDIQARKSCSR